jgi:hypothetical protein
MTKKIENTIYISVLLSLFILVMCIDVKAVEICFNNTDTNSTICNNFDIDIFPQNINLWEGQNDNYNVFIENPTELNPFQQLLKNTFNTNKVDVSKLTDEWTFTFQDYNDFYNIVQQSNALGNVTLFTQADLNKEYRARTTFLTSQVLGYTVTLIVVLMELLKIMFSVITIVIMIYLFFRLLPWVFKKVNTIMVKFAVRGK